MRPHPHPSHPQDRLVVMKGKAKEQIKTVQAQHEAILASTNSLKEQYVKEMEVSQRRAAGHSRAFDAGSAHPGNRTHRNMLVLTVHLQTRRQMVTDHERLTAKLQSSRDEAAELNEEVTALQDTVGQLQRKVLFQRTSGPAP